MKRQEGLQCPPLLTNEALQAARSGVRALGFASGGPGEIRFPHLLTALVPVWELFTSSQLGSPGIQATLLSFKDFFPLIPLTSSGVPSQKAGHSKTGGPSPIKSPLHIIM